MEGNAYSSGRLTLMVGFWQEAGVIGRWTGSILLEGRAGMHIGKESSTRVWVDPHGFGALHPVPG